MVMMRPLLTGTIILAAFTVMSIAALAAPARSSSRNDNYDLLRHSVSNHENELRMIEAKFHNVETIIDSLRQQMERQELGHQESVASSNRLGAAQVADLEFLIKGLSTELQQVKSYVNELSGVLASHKQNASDMEKAVAQQNQNLQHLQAAMKSMMEALDSKDSDDVALEEYRVKPGDSLGKIAEARRISIKAIKELNDLKDDNRIRVGQKLKLPYAKEQ